MAEADSIGKIERVPLRDVWKHEALDFTKWLQDNIDVLNSVLDFTLANPESEQSAGDFNVDIVAADENGNVVVVENQFGKSDHDHLGKVITYLTAFAAKKAVWIVENPRPEHVAAVTWLNESSGADFYLLKVDAIRIAGSPPAPLLTLIVGPSDTTRQVGVTKKELAERDLVFNKFWAGLLEMAKKKTKLHSSISPGSYNWIGTSAGVRGLNLNYSVAKHRALVELYIDRGKGADKENEQIYDALAKVRADVDTAFGEPLQWQRLDGKRACRISKQFDMGGYGDEEKWPQIQDAMIDSMVRLEKALRPHIDALKSKFKGEEP